VVRSNRFLVFTGVSAGYGWYLGHGHIALDRCRTFPMSSHHPYQLGSEPPSIIEDRSRYPIVTALLAARTLRQCARSYVQRFLFSLVFEDGTTCIGPFARGGVLANYCGAASRRSPSAIVLMLRCGWSMSTRWSITGEYSLADLRPFRTGISATVGTVPAWRK